MSEVYVTAPGGMTFHLIYDDAAAAAPASFRQGIEAAALLLSQEIKDQITVNLTIDYSGTGGGASAKPDKGKNENYATIRQDLINSSASTFASVLPAGTEIQGQSKVAVWNAQLKAFGLMDANDTTSDDGSATFSTDIPTDQLVGVALHELSHALGRSPNGPEPDIFDLFRFSSAGTMVFDGTSNPTATSPAPSSYFSLDGGVTKLGDYGTTSDPSDFLNSGVQGKTDSFNEFYNASTNQFLSTVDLLQLDALGFNTPVQTASSAADLSDDIRKFDLASQATGGDGTHYLITLTPNATLTETSAIFAINLRGDDTLTIDGQGATLDGAGQGRGLFVYSGNVTIDNLTIANAVAKGGDGGFGGGGGGAGLGGGLFVASDTAHGAASSQVTLNDVVFTDDGAVGGAGASSASGGFYVGGGGGGGLGGDGSAAGAYGAGNIVTGGRGGGGGGGGGGGIGQGVGFGAAGVGGAGGDGQTQTTHGLPGGGGDGGMTGLIPGVGPGLFGYSGGGVTDSDRQGHTYPVLGGVGGAAGSDGGGGGGGGGGAGGGSYGAAGGGGEGGGIQGGGHQGYNASGGVGGFGGGGGGGVQVNGFNATGIANGGAGGFGGGGGGEGAAEENGASSGPGGYGGGGGGGLHAGTAGFGGGGGYQTGGGGGLGAGGDVFVQYGATLTINGGSLAGGKVTKGAGGASGANPGSAYGAGIFLQGDENIAFAPAAGQTTVISDVITDEYGAKNNQGSGLGKGSITLNGPGTLDLAVDDSFYGGETIKQGTLEIGASGAARGNLYFTAMGGGTLLVDASIGAGGLGSVYATVNSFDASNSFDFAGFDPTKTTARFVDPYGPALLVTDGTRTDVIDFAYSLDLTGVPFYVSPDSGTGSIVSLRAPQANTPPSLTGAPTSIAHPGPPDAATVQTLAQYSVISDADSANLVGATISLGASYFDGDVLTAETSVAGVTENYANGVLTFSGAGSLANYQLLVESVAYYSTADDPTNAGADPSREVTFTLDDGGASNNLSAPVTENVTFAAACYCRGTRILTARGEVEIEALRIGDLAVTADGGARPIVWIGHRRIDVSRHPDPLAVRPVRVSANAFGARLPHRELWLSPGHNVAWGGALIPISLLINGVSVTQLDRELVEYWHLELDGHDIVVAEGLAAESYLDCGNRTAFNNGGAFVEAYPDFEPKYWADTCLPLVKQGPAVAAAKARLLERLFERGHLLDQQADAHILVDGLRIDPLRIASRLAFLLPAGGRDIALCSKRFVPAQACNDSSDGRDLGLAVSRLQIDGENVSLDRAGACGPGWHSAEFEEGRFARRWTRGAAVLPAGARVVIVDLVGAGHYWRDPDKGAEERSA